MTTPSTRIAAVVDAVTDRIAQEGSIKFGELIEYLDTCGINTAGDEALTGIPSMFVWNGDQPSVVA